MKRINIWFDRLPQGERFIVFLAAIALPMAMPLVLPSPWMGIGVIFACFMGLMRMWHLHGGTDGKIQARSDAKRDLRRGSRRARPL